MQDLKTYLQDGAGHQARAVLTILQESEEIVKMIEWITNKGGKSCR